MLARISKYLFMVIIIIMLAVFIPKYYWITFGERSPIPLIYYSPVNKHFIYGSFENYKYTWKDDRGTVLSISEKDSLLPITNYRLLLTKSKMPDSLNGVAVNIDTVRKNNLFIRIKPVSIDPPSIPVYPLFESRPPRIKLEMPREFFRFSDQLDIFDARTKHRLPGMSKLFSSALEKEGFEFPAQKVFGNITTRKAFDEGYFILDKSGKLFHLKRVNDKPYCRKVETPAGFSIKWMSVKEFTLKEFYGIIVTGQDELYILLYDTYKLKKLPVSDYESENDRFHFSGNMFYRIFVRHSAGQSFAVCADRNYEVIDTFRIRTLSDAKMMYTTIAGYLFPFSISIINDVSYFADLHFSAYNWDSIYFNSLLFLILLALYKKRGVNVIKNIPNALIAMLFGVFGFIALLILNLGIDE